MRMTRTAVLAVGAIGWCLGAVTIGVAWWLTPPTEQQFMFRDGLISESASAGGISSTTGSVVPGITATTTTAQFRPQDAAQFCATQVERATREYIAFCIKHAPDVYPRCSMTGGVPSGFRGGYFEVLDCSWHEGKNPRDPTLAQKQQRDREYEVEMARRAKLPPPAKGVFPDGCTPTGSANECSTQIGMVEFFSWDEEHKTWMNNGITCSGFCPNVRCSTVDYYGNAYRSVHTCPQTVESTGTGWR